MRKLVNMHIAVELVKLTLIALVLNLVIWFPWLDEMNPNDIYQVYGRVYPFWRDIVRTEVSCSLVIAIGWQSLVGDEAVLRHECDLSRPALCVRDLLDAHEQHSSALPVVPHADDTRLPPLPALSSAHMLPVQLPGF